MQNEYIFCLCIEEIGFNMFWYCHVYLLILNINTMLRYCIQSHKYWFLYQQVHSVFYLTLRSFYSFSFLASHSLVCFALFFSLFHSLSPSFFFLNPFILAFLWTRLSPAPLLLRCCHEQSSVYFRHTCLLSTKSSCLAVRSCETQKKFFRITTHFFRLLALLLLIYLYYDPFHF